MLDFGHQLAPPQRHIRARTLTDRRAVQFVGGVEDVAANRRAWAASARTNSDPDPHSPCCDPDPRVYPVPLTA